MNPVRSFLMLKQDPFFYFLFPDTIMNDDLHNLSFGELYRHLFAIVNLTKADLLFCEIFF